ncbi:MAG: 3-deoxy-manno-octulosonate cytidylyltransferase [Planctomycetota bacterium]|nr:MAG: 3-deoxy-manno-octulosonate cytidylyltransferase [Planctomycetota bacterium]
MVGNESDRSSKTIPAVVIPARLQSTRLPRKMLLAETGLPLVVHTYRRALAARLPQVVVVACDSPEVQTAVEAAGGRAIMTDPNLASGTDRVAAVASQFAEFDPIVNLQGDEPEIDPRAIDLLIELLARTPEAEMATLATPIRDRAVLEDPSCVKVVCDAAGNALYFSRSVIPHPREWSDDMLTAEPPLFRLHVGIYAYRRDFLLRFREYAPSPLEETERLEQLRALWYGHRIVVGEIPHHSPGIDTLEDYRRFVERHQKGIT